MGVEQELVRHLVQCRIEDIPPETIRRQKLFFADTIGVAVGGVGAPGVQPVIDMIVETGGRPESSLLLRGEKVPSFLAALGNTFMAHALDFDDMHEEAGIHANVCVIPAALAVAEKIGDVDGKAVLAAVVCGVDLACRMGVSIPLLRGWHATTTFGIFGAAAAACKILGLDEEATANAFGIAYSQAAGNRQGRLEGTLTKRLQVALAAQSGVLAALLASRGLTGPKNFLEGDWGMLNLYTDREQKERRLAASDSLLKDLGKRFLGDELSMKPYPTCKATHTPIQNTIELMRQHCLTPEDVEEVSVLISNGAYQTAGRPFVIRTDPQVDAQFSIPYTVATAVLTGNVGLEDLREETVRDNRRMEMTKRIKVVMDPELAEPSTNVVNLSSTVRIKAGGRDYVMASRMSKGHPESPMAVEEIFSKFLYCYRYGLARMPADKVRTFFNTIMSMEEVEDGSVFIRMLNEGG
jgi:2-methylcitrate dehydratase PrpD